MGEWFQRDMVTENSVILNKQLLTNEQLTYLLEEFEKSTKNDNSLDNKIISYITLPDKMIEDWTKKLSSYIPIDYIYPEGCFKKYKYGGIKEHSDVSYYDEKKDKFSTYTLLIYLSDSNSGQTAIKRSKYRSIDDDKSKKNERIFLKPTKGYCAVFNSELKHFANDSYDGKLVLHTRIF